jgi:glycosyltransferase involved in cell wall biosynthesis
MPQSDLPLTSAPKDLSIGMFGMWGMNVPGRRFAGFEAAFSEIAPRLVEQGYSVTIYCRRGEYAEPLRIGSHQGVRLVYVPAPGGKNFSGLVSTLFAVLHGVVRGRYDVFFFVNVGMGLHCALARALGQRVVLNVDGLDWQRGKWGLVGRSYFRIAAEVAARVCTELVTDAEAMRRFYLEHFRRDSTMIAYGSYVQSSTEPQLVGSYGVTPGEYYLIVSRLIPENTLDVIVEAYVASGSEKPLLVVGSANYEDAFHRRLHALANDHVHFVGHVHDQAVLRELWCNCYAYFHGHSVGGTNPALLNAMGFGACILALDTVFNREVLADTGLFWERDVDALRRLILQIEAEPELASRMRQMPQQRIRERYTWERISAQYSELFERVGSS